MPSSPPDRALVLAFYPAETEERARPNVERVREALALPPEATPRLVVTGPAIVIEAAPSIGPEETWTQARERLDAAPPALAEAVKSARLVSHLFLSAAADGLSSDRLPRTRLPEGDVVDLGPGHAPGERLLLVGAEPDRIVDRVRPILARLSAARRQLEVSRTYTTEILREKQVVDASINKVLRYRIGHAKGSEAIQVLEEHLQEMSQNYARLTRNAWIIDGALADLKGEVEMLEKEVERVPRAGTAGHEDDALSRFAEPIRAELTRIERQGRLVHESLETAKTALATHSMNVEIVRSAELVELQKSTEELQKKAVSFQSAAVLIELVIVFAYTLHSWETIAGKDVFEKAMDGWGWFKFAAALAFAVLLALSAHEVAHRIKEGRFAKRARFFFAATIGVVVLMCAVTIWKGRHASADAHAPPHDGRK